MVAGETGMEIDQSKIRGITVLRLRGNIIGPPTSTALSERFSKLITENVTKLILDLEEVDWLNISGMGVIMNGLARIRENKGEIKLARPTFKVKTVLEITRFNAIIEVFNTMDDALESFI